MQKKSKKPSKTKYTLEENEIFYKHLIEVTPDAIVIHSEGRIAYINSVGLKLVGAKKTEEIIGKSVMDFIHPDSIPLIKYRIKKMLNNKKVAPYAEEKFITLQGEIIFAETKAVPFTYQGKPAILAILRDITDKKKEQERQQFLNNMSKLLSSSIDYKTTLKHINESIVPSLADYSRIVLVGDRNDPLEVFAFHSDMKRIKYVEKLYEEYKDRARSTYGIGRILKTGKPELMENVTSKVVSQSKNNKHLKHIVEILGLVSYMGVPLKIQGKVIGAITFSSVKKERIYTKDDLYFAEEVGRRIAYALENTRLYVKAQKMHEAEEKLAAIVSFSDDAIISKTLKGIITSWNNAAERMFGYKADEAVGKPIYIIVPKDRWNEEEELIKRIKKGLHIDHYETIRIRKDGQPLSVSASISAIKNSEGKIVGVSNITRDITEKKKVENELAHLASLVESSSDAIWSRTLDNKILSWNKGAEAMYGFRGNEIVGKDIQDFTIPHDKRGELEEITQKILNGEQIQSLESARLTKDRRRIDVSMTISPLKDALGKVVGTSAIVRNITEQKEQEKLKDEFISMASHELKTPITSLKMFLDILESSLIDIDHIEMLPYVNRIKDQANKIRDLVNDLLDISRIGAGKLHFNLEKFQLEELIIDTIGGIQPAARKHRLIFKNTSAFKVNADKFRIYQVITNLVNNAIKYSPKADKVIITASKNRKRVIVSVKDFGIGIAKDKQKKIFEKLYQVSDPQVKTFPGLGMGLYISNEIIKRHNGAIWVKSDIGKGSTFFFSLPLV